MAEPANMQREGANLPLMVKRTAGKADCLPACAIVTLCREPWVSCCSSIYDTCWSLCPCLELYTANLS